MSAQQQSGFSLDGGQNFTDAGRQIPGLTQLIADGGHLLRGDRQHQPAGCLRVKDQALQRFIQRTGMLRMGRTVQAVGMTT